MNRCGEFAPGTLLKKARETHRLLPLVKRRIYFSGKFKKKMLMNFKENSVRGWFCEIYSSHKIDDFLNLVKKLDFDISFGFQSCL